MGLGPIETFDFPFFFIFSFRKWEENIKHFVIDSSALITADKGLLMSPKTELICGLQGRQLSLGEVLFKF